MRHFDMRSTVTDAYARSLIDHHPLEVARVLEGLDLDQALAELLELPARSRPLVVENFSEPFAARLLGRAEAGDRREWLREMPSEVAVDILAHVSNADAERFLAELPTLHREEVEELRGYPEDTAGSAMSPEVTALRADATVADALTRLRRLARVGDGVSYVYVVDEEEELVGVLLMRDLVLALPRTPLREVMIGDVARVYVDDPLERVADVLAERNLLAVPVVDDGERLRGVVSGSALASELVEEGFEDAQKMFGAGADEHASSPAGFAIRKRLPWLQINLATAFLAAAVVGAFESVIAELTVLAAFLPVVAGQGGNAGAQALAVMLRALALGEIRHAASRVVLKEAVVGLVNGVATGAVAGAIAWLATGLPGLGAVVFVAMIGNLAVAGAAGAAIPLLLDRAGQDPAQSSNILLTTVTDIVGFASFLGLAVLARGWLLP